MGGGEGREERERREKEETRKRRGGVEERLILQDGGEGKGKGREGKRGKEWLLLRTTARADQGREKAENRLDEQTKKPNKNNE